MSEEPQEDEEEKAREDAEARRQKILQSSQDRLGVVTGVVEEPEEVKNKGLSKMAAARRRRFKKKDDDDINHSETKKDDSGATAGGDSTGADAAPASDVTANKEQEQEPEHEPAPKLLPEKEEKSASAEVPAPEPISSAAESESDTNSTKKKYKGVARIRRQMLKERQMRADDDQQHEATTAATATADGHHVPPRARKFYTTLPILMHVVTVLLLFGAGLDVGLQQRPAPTAEVHTVFAPQQELHILRAFSSSKTKDSNLPSADELLQHAESQELLVERQDDEFQVSDGSGPNNAEPTIDPLFGVDLDLYTQGDSLYMTSARFAVKLHRLNLSIFYYFPRRIVLFIKQTLMQFTKSPPLLCLVAIVIRQIVAKGILGANLPKPDKENEPQKDVLGMVKQFLHGFLTKAFPTVFTLYDIFSHLKNDMFVVICGLLVGLAIRHSETITPPKEIIGMVTEEVAGVGETEILGGGTEEL